MGPDDDDGAFFRFLRAVDDFDALFLQFVGDGFI